MAKLTVKNVGPIREAELEVKKHTVFIGPQGTGKSTLAKLIAIGGDYSIVSRKNELYEQYNIHPYFKKASLSNFIANEYECRLRLNDTRFRLGIEKAMDYTTYKKAKDEYDALEELKTSLDSLFNEVDNSFKNGIPPHKTVINNANRIVKEYEERSAKFNYLAFTSIVSFITSYIPAERTLISILSNSIWNLINSEINLPKLVTLFASNFEQARAQSKSIHVPFLNIIYKYRQNDDMLISNSKKSMSLAQSASGYQSIIPLLLVVEHQRRQSRRRFIIEEPELNLYPTAQKDLIYSLIGGLQPDVEYQDAEWVITTHSPYVLTSLNTLMLAYKVAQRSDELRTEVEKVIPARCWINPDEFAAYYVDNGTVRSIISEKTGLIADSELDDVSEDLAGEQDKLFELSRSVPRA